MTEEDIKEFQRIYFTEFGEHISREEAREYGTRLLALYRAVYWPIQKKD